MDARFNIFCDIWLVFYSASWCLKRASAQVLDARDPNSCRCPELEQEILERGKKVVLVMNKIDLVPQDATVRAAAVELSRAAAGPFCP